MSQGQGLQPDVVNELMRVRRKGLGSLDLSDTDGHQKVLTPHLDDAVREVLGYHRSLTRSAAVRLLLEQEIPLITARTCSAWLPALFGLTDQTRDKTPYDCRTTAAAKIADIPKKNFIRTHVGDERKGLAILATQIVTHCLTDNSIPGPLPNEGPPANPILRFMHEGYPLICVVGSQADGLASMIQHTAAADSIIRYLRNLVQLNAIALVLSWTFDLSLYLGDLLPVHDAAEPFSRTLWQPGGRTKDLAALLTKAADLLSQRYGKPMLVVALGLDEPETRNLQEVANRENIAALQDHPATAWAPSSKRHRHNRCCHGSTWWTIGASGSPHEAQYPLGPGRREGHHASGELGERAWARPAKPEQACKR